MASAKQDRDESKPVKIALNLIKADHALQPRVEMDDEHWNRMARAYVDGEDIPPPIHLFFDGKFYWLVDGFHRYKAMWSIRHMGAKFTQIRAFIHHGSKREAIVYAAQANLDSRSKPMSDEDRKKAMWMLLDGEEYRSKLPGTIAKTIGLSSTTAKRYWVEYFESRSLPVPEYGEAANGHMKPTSTRKRNSSTPPKVSKGWDERKQRWIYSTSIDGNKFGLGSDAGEAQERLSRLVDAHDAMRSRYEARGRMAQLLATHKLHAEPFVNPGNTVLYPGLSGLKVCGVVVVWESFREKANAIAAIGRAIAGRSMTGFSRAVVLCPVEDGPPEILDLGRKAGIEFMTIEEFAASFRPPA